MNESLATDAPAPPVATEAPLLEVKNLEVHFPFRRGGLFTIGIGSLSSPKSAFGPPESRSLWARGRFRPPARPERNAPP